MFDALVRWWRSSYNVLAEGNLGRGYMEEQVEVSLLRQHEHRGILRQKGEHILVPASKVNRLIEQGIAEKVGAGNEKMFRRAGNSK